MKTHDADLPRRLLGALAFACALGAAFWRISEVAAPAFALPNPAPVQAPAFFDAESIPESGGAETIALAQLGDGRIATAWSYRDEYAGIRFSLRGREGWLRPGFAATRESTAGATLARVGRLGSPVLYGEGGWLHLWYTAYPGDGEARGVLLHSHSTNGGISWSRAEKLAVTPFANAGVEAHGTPLALADDGLALPLSQAFPGPASLWLRLDPTGRIVDKIRLPGQAAAGLPGIAPLDEKTALSLSTAAQGSARTLVAHETADGGQSWQEKNATLPPLNAQVPGALLRLASGRLLLAANAPGTRGVLQLWLSADRGRQWALARTVESAADGAADFSQPALLLARDGRVHLAYRGRRQGIRHLSFNEAWLNGEGE